MASMRAIRALVDPRPMRKGLKVLGERIIKDLRGTAYLRLELVPARWNGCAVTQWFSGRVTDRETLDEAVAAMHRVRQEAAPRRTRD